MQEIHPRHKCGQCGYDCPSLNLLQQHISTQHPTIVQYRCCSHKGLSNDAAIFEHLESGSCESQDAKVLYTLLSECPDAQTLVLRGREPFLLAGPPRTVALQSDFEPRKSIWKCPYCKISQETAADLSQHLQAQDYSIGYPRVINCSSCEMTFKTLSALFRHLEATHAGCKADTHSGPALALTKYLRTEGEKPDYHQRQRFGDLTYGLRTDPLRPGMLYVKVTSNIASDSERVPL